MKKLFFTFLLLFNILNIQSQLHAQSISTDFDDLMTKLESLGSQSGSLRNYFTDSELSLLQDYKSIQNIMQIQLGTNPFENNELEYITKAYGYEAFMPGNVSFDITVPSLLNVFGPGDPNEYAGAINPNDPTEAYTLRMDGGFYSLDITTGESTYLTSFVTDFITEIAFNPVDNTLYAVSGNSLFVIDPLELTISFIGYMNLTGETLGFTIDGNGNAYLYDYTDVLYGINLSTGESSYIGYVGFNAEFNQGMSWDPESDTIYMTAFNFDTLYSELRSVNVETGMTTLLGTIGTSVVEMYWVSFVTEEAPVSGGNCDLDGDTTNGPIWDRPLSDGSGMDANGIGVTYSVYGPFTVDTAGSYTFNSTQTGWDGMIFIYQNNFDSANPLVNFVAGNDDFEESGTSQILTDLEVGVSYYLVTTGYEPTDFGAFTTTISGPGTANCEIEIEETCDWTVIVSGQTYGHFISWNLKHGDLVLLSGGQYITDGFYDLKQITFAGPVEFHIVSGEDTFGGSLTYTVANGTEIIAMGQIIPGQEATHSNLECGNSINGCLEAPLGQFPATTFNPECSGEPELISSTAKTGEYSVVNLSTEKEYVFSSSVETDFITISNEGGTEILASGIGSVNFVSAVDQTIRYYMHLDEQCTYSESTNRSKYLMCSAILGPPQNDICANAIAVNCGESVSGNTYFATDTGGNLANDVYYKFTGSGEPQHITLSLCNSLYDTTIRVFTDCSLSNEIIFNDDFCQTQSELTFYSDGTSTYYIMVEGYNTSMGAFNLDISCEADNYDACEPTHEGNIRTGLSFDSSGGNRAANDFNVLANSQYELEKINLEVISSVDEPTTFDIRFYEGESGVETQIGETIEGLTPTNIVEIGTHGYFNYPVYSVEITLPNSIIFPASSTSDKKYWVAINAEPSVGGGEISWASYIYYSPRTLPAWESTDGGNSWNEYDYGYGLSLEGIMSLDGECATLGMDDVSNIDFAYYPNPTNHIVNFTTQKEITSIQIFNLAGQLMINAQKANEKHINISSLPKGTYLFKVQLDNQQIETFKIIKK